MTEYLNPLDINIHLNELDLVSGQYVIDDADLQDQIDDLDSVSESVDGISEVLDEDNIDNGITYCEIYHRKKHIKNRGNEA